ncbi:hypothetical protein AGABI1DRAFT_116593 [Agaricus bisporus var. burnettii JB137-S8]|uniref:Methyltransferase n=2 Tax=Agaricus bisporus var. burnettii TaxID=192524 RepID=K5XKH8_AGABU|nr:uncharacterized protein AGABI1DRAFT_116593 [Agaricus bisporus var. burnettii JB137-S8]EKM75015.1 hypothetical protein AGABI1DRAFT_116593 [Agaricus bisporus var. burnettii JB137-S8]KAF7763713.1 hypothetical protein Agabi119p4_8250 [Agaricus bisporus var. burnettii]
MSATPITNQDTVSASIKYSIPPGDGSQARWDFTSNDPVTGVEERNFEEGQVNVMIENIRGQEHLYSLDRTGFLFCVRPTKMHASDFQDEKKVKEEYYPESIQLIKDVTGASRVVLFDHTHRLRRPGEPETSSERRQPVSLAHVDQTTAASIIRVRRHLPEEADTLLKRRFQIINLWRPIENPALDWPLALCDFRSVDMESDLFPVTTLFPTHTGETMAVKYNPKHQWKYQHGTTPDEVVLIKCFDSIQDGSVAVLTPHTGFQDPTTPPDAPFRESIELRALVFYDY